MPPEDGLLEAWWPFMRSLDLVQGPLEVVAEAVSAEFQRFAGSSKVVGKWKEFDDLGAVFSSTPYLSLGTGAGLAPATRLLAMATLPNQLAVAFRGVLSFWTAGELSDQLLSQSTHVAAIMVLLGFTEGDDYAGLLALLEAALGPDGSARN